MKAGADVYSNGNMTVLNVTSLTKNPYMNILSDKNSNIMVMEKDLNNSIISNMIVSISKIAKTKKKYVCEKYRNEFGPFRLASSLVKIECLFREYLVKISTKLSLVRNDYCRAKNLWCPESH